MPDDRPCLHCGRALRECRCAFPVETIAPVLTVTRSRGCLDCAAKDTEIARLRAAEANFLSYGQGGASYVESQLMDEGLRKDAEIERLRARVAELEGSNEDDD